MSMLSQKSDDWRHIAVKTQCNNTPNGSPQYTRVPGIPFLAGVVTFTFSIAPTQTLGLIQHPPYSHSLRLHGAIPPFPHYVAEYEV